VHIVGFIIRKLFPGVNLKWRSKNDNMGVCVYFLIFSCSLHEFYSINIFMVFNTASVMNVSYSSLHIYMQRNTNVWSYMLLWKLMFICGYSWNVCVIG
jgi:hypothetical protein